MTSSVWRFAHLALALISSLFLLILSVTGVILAIGAVNEKTQNYKTADFDTLHLSQSLPALGEAYAEITTLTVDHNRFVSIEAIDHNGHPVNAYIDPKTGKILGELKPQSEFIQWNIALHRSLFLKETGRIIVGLVSFFLLLITISGIILIAKRQQGLRNFFSRIKKDFLSQYFHVVSGRIFLVPVLLLALTGTYLFMVRMGLAEGKNQAVSHEQQDHAPEKAADQFAVFRETLLSEVEKVEFPFIPGDPEEFYILKLKDRELSIHQLTGEVIEENRYPYSLLAEKLSLDLHTGRTSVVWAVILGFASLNILFFIYTGFAITLRRKKTKIRNRHSAATAEYILLAGSENGSTLHFANHVHQQLLNQGHTSYLTEMNRFTQFPKARHFLIFTSTYGRGTAPANADRFESLITRFAPCQTVNYSVIGFGSKAYPDFCAFARLLDQELEKKPWANRYLALHTVNDRSPEELVSWVNAWSQKAQCELSSTPALYTPDPKALSRFKVLKKTQVTEDNSTFQLLLRPLSRQAFRSGDLLAVYPAADHRERLYSIGKTGPNIQLMVKLHSGGLGSEYLYSLEENTVLSARVLINKPFHFPGKAAAVVMIANGTGIAPFLGMISENKKPLPLRLYAGFRHSSPTVDQYREFAREATAAGRLESFQLAFSRGENPRYVMDLIRKDAAFFAEHIATKGIVMICGSLAMQKDVEAVLAEICNTPHLAHCREQIRSDCY